ncbi:hypothetical protein ES705_06493 [subsurface metagenome]|nr:hypothetical protein [Clostridia bacterium]
MSYRRLFIWVEGGDDLRFFDRIIKPMLKGKYDLVEVRSYAKLRKEKISSFLKSIKSMKAGYIYVTDINDSPCITARKQEILDEVKNVDENRIVVVIKEIEGWYLAGLGIRQCKDLGICTLNSTDKITKEQFDGLIPREFYSRINFMLEILNCFSISVAKQKNRSFKYFTEECDKGISGRVSTGR